MNKLYRSLPLLIVICFWIVVIYAFFESTVISITIGVLITCVFIIFERKKAIKRSIEGAAKDDRLNAKKPIDRIALETFKEAQELYNTNKFEDALPKLDCVLHYECFDEAYVLRAFALQSCNYHIEAISDFSKIIELEPNNASFYSSRASSKSSLCDYEGAIIDTLKAIELSHLTSAANQHSNEKAQALGYSSASQFYKQQLERFQLYNRCSDGIKKALQEKTTQKVRLSYTNLENEKKTEK